MTLSAGPGEVSVFFEARHTLILLGGTIDLVVSDDLENAGRDAIDEGRPIVVDAAKVELIDSVGVAFLVRLAAAGRDGGWSVSLRNPPPLLCELLDLVGASPLFDTQP
jgi:anti-anti-sigma factor